MNEAKKRIRWKCRRGMLELDQLLLNFFDQQYDGLSKKEKESFSELLTYPDPIIWKWLSRQEEAEPIAMKVLVKKILEN